MNDPKIPEDGVSGKLKAVVYILTGITLLAFIAFFTKLATKESVSKKQEVFSNDPRISELNIVGERLLQAGLIEQSLDQYIEIWNRENANSSIRAQAAASAGQLYLKLGNCKEGLVWLFRSAAANPEKTNELQPLIDTCIGKEK